MSTSHTKGPWSIQTMKTENQMGREIFVIPEGTQDDWIAHVENATDAKLICAAPDLLEALQDLVEDAECETCDKCDGSGVNPHCETDACHACAGAGEIVRHPIWPQFLKNAKAAIQKATK